jgi:flagellar export protein FliJ
MKEKPSRFHQVIKVKKFGEKKAHAELVEIRATQVKEGDELRALGQRKARAIDTVIHTMRARATEAQSSRAFIHKLSREIRQQEKKVQDLHVREEEKRLELTQRSQSRKMVEKLDEKHQTALNKEIERKDQRLLDVLSRRLSASS